MKWFSLINLAVVLAFSLSANAQQTVHQLTAREAVDLAFNNVADLKNAKLDYKIAEARNKEITSAAYPQITSTAAGNHYLSLPLIQFPDATELAIYDVLKREGVRDGTGTPIIADGDFQVRNFSFIQPWNVNIGATVQQLLFEPQVFVGLQARKALLESSDLQIKVAEDKVRENVYKSYYAVLIAEKQLKYIQESIKRLEKLSSDMGVMYKNGFAEKLDIDKTTVTLNNIKTAENQLKNGISVSYAALKMTLGLYQADSLVLKDTLSNQMIKDGLLNEGFSYENRNEIKLLNKSKELQGYDVRRWKLSYFPTVAAFYGYQKNGQRSANDAVGSKPWFWYSQSQVGLNVNIPIFDGFNKKYKIQQAQLNIQKTESTLDQAKKGIDLEINVSKSTLNTAIHNLDVQEDNMQLAERVYNTVKKKYEQGLGSSFEVLQSDNEMQQAQSNYFKALYEATVAKINYLKALGKL
jgi:outer membrane protein